MHVYSKYADALAIRQDNLTISHENGTESTADFDLLHEEIVDGFVVNAVYRHPASGKIFGVNMGGVN